MKKNQVLPHPLTENNLKQAPYIFVFFWFSMKPSLTESNIREAQLSPEKCLVHQLTPGQDDLWIDFTFVF